MKYLIKLLGLCCVAALAVGVMVSATASAALPEIEQCAKTTEEKTGNYEDNLCSKKVAKSNFIRVHLAGKTCQKVLEPGTGNFEDGICSKALAGGEFIRTIVAHGFKSTGGAGTLETKGGTKVTCKAEKQEKGEFTGDKTVAKVIITFTGCESSGFKCNTAKAEAGEIKTNELNGEIGYLEKATKKVGLKLVPTGGGNFAEFSCAGIVKVTVRGTSYGEIKVTGFSKTGELNYEQAKGKPKWAKFEGEAENKLESSVGGGAFEESGIATKATVESEGDAVAIEA
jgi:hypothetical protein